MSYKIPFNRIHTTGKEKEYISKAIDLNQISGNGIYTKKCTTFFNRRYGFKHSLLTTSCTDALEMSAILINIKPGDEVIMPSFTFVSTANAFILRGAKIIFCDSKAETPGIDEDLIEGLITKRTKAIVAVHYAGIACNMQKLKSICDRYKIFLIEDAAQAIDSYYSVDGKPIPLGSFGDLATFSFHETKNIICGEGGLLVVNNENLINRSEIIWEKGTNRSAFFRGEIDKYGWVDLGSSFLPSELNSAFLYAQIENLDNIQNKRKLIWEKYFNELQDWCLKYSIGLPHIPNYATNNAHMFYLICKSNSQREKIITGLKRNQIQSVFHYQSLHKSVFFESLHDGRTLSNSDRFSNCLLRLPLFYNLNVIEVIDKMKSITL